MKRERIQENVKTISEEEKKKEGKNKSKKLFQKID